MYNFSNNCLYLQITAFKTLPRSSNNCQERVLSVSFVFLHQINPLYFLCTKHTEHPIIFETHVTGDRNIVKWRQRMVAERQHVKSARKMRDERYVCAARGLNMSWLFCFSTTGNYARLPFSEHTVCVRRMTVTHCDFRPTARGDNLYRNHPANGPSTNALNTQTLHRENVSTCRSALMD